MPRGETLGEVDRELDELARIGQRLIAVESRLLELERDVAGDALTNLKSILLMQHRAVAKNESEFYEVSEYLGRTTEAALTEIKHSESPRSIVSTTTDKWHNFLSKRGYHHYLEE